MFDGPLTQDKNARMKWGSRCKKKIRWFHWQNCGKFSNTGGFKSRHQAEGEKFTVFRKKCLSIRDFCRGLWEKKSLLWEIVHLSRKWLVQIIWNIKWHGTKEKPKSCIFSTQKPPKWCPRTIFSLSNYFYSVTNFRVWMSWPWKSKKFQVIFTIISMHWFELWRIKNVLMLRSWNL